MFWVAVLTCTPQPERVESFLEEVERELQGVKDSHMDEPKFELVHEASLSRRMTRRIE